MGWRGWWHVTRSPGPANWQVQLRGIEALVSLGIRDSLSFGIVRPLPDTPPAPFQPRTPPCKPLELCGHRAVPTTSRPPTTRQRPGWPSGLSVRLTDREGAVPVDDEATMPPAYSCHFEPMRAEGADGAIGAIGGAEAVGSIGALRAPLPARSPRFPQWCHVTNVRVNGG